VDSFGDYEVPSAVPANPHGGYVDNSAVNKTAVGVLVTPNILLFSSVSENSISSHCVAIYQRCLLVQTNRGSVTFPEYRFRPGKWYHVVVVHEKSGQFTEPQVSLFVNGIKVHEHSKSLSWISVSDEDTSVRAYIGSAKVLSPARSNDFHKTSAKMGYCPLVLPVVRWRLGLCFMLEGSVSAKVIAEIYQPTDARHFGAEPRAKKDKRFVQQAFSSFQGQLAVGNKFFDKSTTLFVPHQIQTADVPPILEESNFIFFYHPANNIDNTDANNLVLQKERPVRAQRLAQTHLINAACQAIRPRAERDQLGEQYVETLWATLQGSVKLVHANTLSTNLRKVKRLLAFF
jgi:hypothetical protein